jgi:choline monooxygenase
VTTDTSTVLEAPNHTDPSRNGAEGWAVFARQWTALDAVGRPAAPGAYVSAWMAGFPLVLANHDGILRAFQNVCRHRAGPLVDQGSRKCRPLVRRSHGWAFTLEGRLPSARALGAELDAVDVFLLTAGVAAWRGLPFVALQPAEPDLEVWLASVTGRSESFPMESFEVTHRLSHDLASNWTVYAGNYQEGCHIPLVDPGRNRQIDAADYAVEIDGATSRHTAPTRVGSLSGGAWLWRFPGFALNLSSSGLCLESYWPTGPTSRRVEYTVFFARAHRQRRLTGQLTVRWPTLRKTG